MHDVGSLVQAATAGAVLGGMFLVGLWWTVRLIMIANHPVPWFLASLLLRMSAVLAGFYLSGVGTGSPGGLFRGLCRGESDRGSPAVAGSPRATCALARIS